MGQIKYFVVEVGHSLVEVEQGCIGYQFAEVEEIERMLIVEAEQIERDCLMAAELVVEEQTGRDYLMIVELAVVLAVEEEEIGRS